MKKGGFSKFFVSANKVKNATSAFAQRQNDGTGKKNLGAWIPGTAGITTTTVEISISCRNLADKDLLSKSDPMVVVFNRPPGSRGWIQFMRTEMIIDDLNPDFVTKATMEYRFEQVQPLRFEVYDIDAKTHKLMAHDKIGVCDVNLGQIVSAGDEGLIRELTDLRPSILGEDPNKPRPVGTIILTAEELASEKDELTLKLGGSSIGSWSGLLPPKSYFVISKMNEAQKFLVVHRSNPSRGTKTNWKESKIPLRTLCNGDHNRKLKIEVFQRKFRGQVVHQGEALLTLTEMLKYGPHDRIALKTPTGNQCKTHIRIINCTVSPINTLIDYIQAGTQIHCCFAIDFTCSNGDPTDQESLHFLSNSGLQPNAYEQAIHAVGNILKDYDMSEMMAFGFGARIPPKGEISYDFNLTLGSSPCCSTLQGVLDAYKACVPKIQLFGPTYFAPIIKTVTDFAKESKNGEHYYILIILTDGVITDLAKTKKAIVQGSAYPLSIVIIGIGEADFDAMEELDGDAVRLSYRGKLAERDIVQFVAYRSARAWLASTGEATGGAKVQNYQSPSRNMLTRNMSQDDDDGTSSPPLHLYGQKKDGQKYESQNQRTNRLAQGQLAMEVLAEIPDQLRGYMLSKGIMPHMIKQWQTAKAIAKTNAEQQE